MYRDNRLPKSLRVEKLPTGVIRLYPDAKLQTSPKRGDAVIYARINPRYCRSYLEAQVSACKLYCFSMGWVVKEVIREIAPGTGQKRPKLSRLLDNPPARVVVLTQSVLSRFDFALIAKILAYAGCAVTVLDQSQEMGNEGAVLEDIIDAISMTCNRHYGIKRGALLVEALKKILRNNDL
jgi:putative resolvase